MPLPDKQPEERRDDRRHAVARPSVAPLTHESRAGWLEKTKDFVLGRPLRNSESSHQRLSNPVALAVFSGDALSSVSYAGQEIMLTLALAGSLALRLAWPISLAIGCLLVVVVLSYSQTIKAYPHGGGSYTVAKENLGTYPGLVAGSSLLVDYTLNAAVSISAGTAAVTSAFPVLYAHRTEVALGFLALLTLANLRGVKEAGALFAAPTYLFIAAMYGTVLFGAFRYFAFGPASIRVPTPAETGAAVSGLTLFLVARAFSSGCTAMTGVEAIANGVQAFREPEHRNARITLLWMGGILLTMFLGLAWLATAAGIRPSETETVISQISHGLYGGGILYYLVSAATMLILVLAANTSYADFPRLASFMAADDFMPHQFTERGQRLVFSKGIIALSAMAGLLILVFRAEVTALIPLFAIGAFTSFTLSQAGMVVHWLRHRERGWVGSMGLNGFGAAATFVVTLVIAVSKFASGAWIVLVVIPVLVAVFGRIRHHYRFAAAAATPAAHDLAACAKHEDEARNAVVVLVKSLDRRTIAAVHAARRVAGDSLTALHVDIRGDGAADSLRAEWERCGFGFPLVVIDSPFREMIDPVVEYVRSIERGERDTVTVVMSEFSPANRLEIALHAQTTMWLGWSLSAEPGVVTVNVPYHFHD